MARASEDNGILMSIPVLQWVECHVRSNFPSLGADKFKRILCNTSPRSNEDSGIRTCSLHVFDVLLIIIYENGRRLHKAGITETRTPLHTSSLLVTLIQHARTLCHHG
eukprot:6481370-Amphidinium_carterae.1